ncbi:hypothetical protein HXX76_010458 [Chlamydomonas incerta]|uniref:EGF-like domain-containing protein n=1 Tax=Chlamydomonas incerta TaxID=51695 RepID=A0A835SWW6_CHLIN|nr:hypothetical protein HXX76_010458 [Chlamydomonas incerta]|eukprot:KAG2428310.1 hypothetical protein HXX76_010458 [Chlamydomonas incerta]
MLKDAVKAAYAALRKYISAKAPSGQLLADPIVHTYELIPSPPPPPPSPPAPPSPPPEPQAPPFPPSRRLLLSKRQQESEREDILDLASAASAASASSSQAAASAGGARRGLLQAAAASRTATYPDFSAGADPRLTKCGRATINTKHVRKAAGSSLSVADTPGEYTDLYLYVTADNSGPGICPPLNDIRAATCLYDAASRRPVMAAINVCPSALDEYDTNTLVTRILRAMITALGVERVGFFGAAAPSVYTAAIAPLTDAGGNDLRFLATPAVKQAARTFFACADLPGAMMENLRYSYSLLDGADSSVVFNASLAERLATADYADRMNYAFVGWEFTHFQEDILVGSNELSYSGLAPQVTQLTLALLSDTNWYAVNVNSQGYWTYGRGKGCAFGRSHCSALLNATSAAGDSVLICDTATYGAKQQLCAAGGVAVGTCEQHDGACGVVRSATPGLPTCLLKELELITLSGSRTDAAALYGWGSGFTSRCSPVRWPWSARTSSVLPAQSWPAGGAPSPPTGGSCFRALCGGAAGNELSFNVLGTQVRCPTGALVNLTAALPAGSGLVAATLGPCPYNDEVCAVSSPSACTPASCSPRGGECRDGRCYCRAGYSGADCTTDLMTGLKEDLAGQTAAYSLLEVSVALKLPLSRFYARQAQFLKVISDNVFSGFTSSLTAQLSVARVQTAASLPDTLRPLGETNIQVVTRFAAANSLQADLFERAFRSQGLPTAALDALGFTTLANSTVYLGQTVLRTMPPPSPPSPPSPPTPPPAPPPSPPAAPPSSGGGGGLSGDEKVAIGVGVSFGVLLLLLLFAGWRSFRRWNEVQQKIVEGEHDKKIKNLEEEIRKAKEHEEEKRMGGPSTKRGRSKHGEGGGAASPEEVQLTEGAVSSSADAGAGAGSAAGARGAGPVVMVGQITTGGGGGAAAGEGPEIK